MNGTYADVHRWNSVIVQVHQQTGVPANVIKAIMWIESRGHLNARSPLTSSGYYFGRTGGGGNFPAAKEEGVTTLPPQEKWSKDMYSRQPGTLLVKCAASTASAD